MISSFVEHFSELQDPRIERKKLHALMDILVLTVCAVASGAEGWEGIAEFGHAKLEWLRRFIPLKTVCLPVTVLPMSSPGCPRKVFVVAL